MKSKNKLIKSTLLLVTCLLLMSFGLVVFESVSVHAQEDDNLFVFRRGNGFGDVVGYINDDEAFNCGSTCSDYFEPGTVIRLESGARDSSDFVGWSDTCDNSNLSCTSSTSSSSFHITIGSSKTIIYSRFELDQIPENPEVNFEDVSIPRIMYWPGKVNQHWDLETSQWETDLDGVSGSRENKLEYCNKFYPDTVKVVEHKREQTNTWKHAGNRGNYYTTKTSYRCILKDENISGKDASNLVEKPNKGSICYYFPDLPLCLPLSDPRAIRYAGIQKQLDDFVERGVDKNSISIGKGERLAVISSYRSAFGNLPETEEGLNDIIKIANGNFPSVRNKTAEDRASEEFKKVYKRISNLKQEVDKAAINIIAYGVRQKAKNRNLESEKHGIKIFKDIYHKLPETTEDWNVMQAITYSGATRDIDSDGDFLIDSREKELGTDPNNPDTDGDGYLDGIEVANGSNPLD